MVYGIKQLDPYHETFIPCMNQKSWTLVKEYPWKDSLDMTEGAYRAWALAVSDENQDKPRSAAGCGISGKK